MKQFLLVGLVVALLLTLSIGAVGAAPLGGPGDRDGVRDLSGQGLGQGNGPAYGFVDENDDGVNDRFVDEDGDGQCDLVAQRQGSGYGRNAQTSAGAGRQGNANGQGRGQGAGAMGRFVDADGNGVCDYLEQN